MAKMKLKWANTEDLAFRLIDEYPSVDPRGYKLQDIQKLVTKLPEFSDDPKKAKDAVLEEIQSKWYDERVDMEDELGPMETTPVTDDDSALDEDDYRDDAFDGDEAEVSTFGDDDDDDEDEDEFGDGFQEEEADG